MDFNFFWSWKSRGKSVLKKWGHPGSDPEYISQEAQLTLTNPRDAFRGQSRSPNIEPFHVLGIVSY